ncbi:Hypothetical predicted protein [Pelobates cultripes]|uniref:Uncharacterized protein n=1 Tax=Pelobates cultripes TaxID=61616 RepID=A0AAD1WK79_PELCU|nr:Hypothetical predicted protein [Pelobates cultripes]
MNSSPTRTSSTVSLPDIPRYPQLKSYMQSYEVSRFLHKCQKERDDAFRREESARDKLKHIEATTRCQIQDLKTKVKQLTSECKALQRTVKKLRTDLGLEGNPRFKGRMTKDIIKELQEREDQCACLKEDNSLLSVQLREIVSIVAQTQKQKGELTKQLENSELKVRDLLNENNQIVQNLQESQREKDDLEKINLMLRKSIEESKKVTNRSVQTTTSIPVNLQNTYKKTSRETSISRTSQVPLDRRKITLEPSNIVSVVDSGV